MSLPVFQLVKVPETRPIHVLIELINVKLVRLVIHIN